MSWIKVVSLFCLLLVLTSTSVTGSFHEEKSTYLTKIFTNDINETEVDLPFWKAGDSWVYSVDFSFQMKDADYEITLNIYVGSLRCIVTQDSGDSYFMEIDGSVTGNFILDVESIPRLSGTFKQTELSGQAFLDKNTLGIKYFDVDVNGKLSFGLISVSLKIDMTMNVDPSYTPLDFPFYVGKIWICNDSINTVEAQVSLTGISSLIPGMPDEFEIPPMDMYIGNNEIVCSETTEIIVPLGKYEAYNVTIDDKYSLFFLPAAGTFLTVIPLAASDDGYDTSFSLELRSTTYRMPGSPDIPERPSGPTSGQPNNEFVYSTSSIDPEGDEIFYFFDWDDGSNSGWLGPYSSGSLCEASHSWLSEGTYQVRVRARDADDHESLWSDPLSVSMPKIRERSLFNIIQSFLENHPYLFPLLRQLFQ